MEQLGHLMKIQYVWQTLLIYVHRHIHNEMYTKEHTHSPESKHKHTLSVHPSCSVLQMKVQHGDASKRSVLILIFIFWVNKLLQGCIQHNPRALSKPSCSQKHPSNESLRCVCVYLWRSGMLILPFTECSDRM